jgi:hypothetical protein
LLLFWTLSVNSREFSLNKNIPYASEAAIQGLFEKSYFCVEDTSTNLKL